MPAQQPVLVAEEFARLMSDRLSAYAAGK